MAKLGGFSRAAGFFFTPFKRMGIMGWSDLGYDGEITVLETNGKIHRSILHRGYET